MKDAGFIIPGAVIVLLLQALALSLLVITSESAIEMFSLAGIGFAGICVAFGLILSED